MAHEVIDLPPIEPRTFTVTGPVGGSPSWDTSKIITEDGKPVDNFYVEKLLRLLTEPLYSSWTPSNNRTFRALSDVGLFNSPDDPAWAPDMMLSMDVRVDVDIQASDHRSYFVWIVGKVPDVVIEVVSDRRGREDTVRMEAYARLQIPHYVIYDYLKKLSKKVLRIFSLKGEKYEESNASIFPEVGLGLKLWKGDYEGSQCTWLRWHDADGNVVPTGRELADTARQHADVAKLQATAAQEQADAAQEHAEAAKQEAAAAKQELNDARKRADAAEHEKQRLLEKLRQLGVSE